MVTKHTERLTKVSTLSHLYSHGNHNNTQGKGLLYNMETCSSRWGLNNPFKLKTMFADDEVHVIILVNTSSGNGLVPGCTKPLPEPILSGSQ